MIDLTDEIPGIVQKRYGQLQAQGRAFYDFVPKEREKNLQFRELLKEVCTNEIAQAFLREVCRIDHLFWLNAYCWVFEPRPNGDHGHGKLPFITWPAQDDAVRVTLDCWGVSDVVVDKARGEGASWLFLMLVLHEWLFAPEDKMFAAGLASRNMDAVDNHRDPDSLMWKLDFQLKNLPVWMTGMKNFDWERTVSDHALLNKNLGHTIMGYSADDDLGTGGRKSVWVWDEMAKFGLGKDRDALNSTEPTSNCRIMISTHKGTANEYYKIVRSPGSVPVIVMDWKNNPTRNKQMFTVKGGLPHGKPVLQNEEEHDETWDAFLEVWPEKASELDKKAYEWTEEKIVSPWYVERCLRAGSTPQTMAQEYDRNPEGTEQQFFSDARLSKIGKECIQPPKHRGDLRFDYDNPLGTVTFTPDPDGNLLLWCDLLAGTPLLDGDACVGCDISSGLGESRTSNSVACAFERNSGHQIAEFATNRLTPDKFASYSLALSKWLHNAQLNWETNGSVGAAFTASIKAIGYHNIYYREVRDRLLKKKTKSPGWGSSIGKKSEILGAAGNGGLRAAIYEGKCVIRSELLLEECRQFIYDENGNVVHAGSTDKADRANRNEDHGDRVIAAAVAWLTVLDRPRQTPQELAKRAKPPQYTMASRLADYDAEKEAQRESGWAW